MTVDELISRLNDLVVDDPSLAEAPVLFAHQPRWPLQCAVDGPNVYCEEDGPIEEILRVMRESPPPEDEDHDEMTAELNRLQAIRQPIVYLCESTVLWMGDREMSPYAPREAWGEQ